MKKETKQKIFQSCGWLGVAGVLFYFLHIIIGGIIYKGYNPVSQAISDLTADGAPSEITARILSGLYGIFNVAFLIAFYLFFRKKLNKAFSLAALLFLIMAAVSAIGFTLFPLSGAGYANTFQDIMHVVITVIVVALSIASLVIFAVGFFRYGKRNRMGYAAIVTLGLMMTGSILLGAVPAILGIGERINIYSLQIYTVLLAVFMLRFKNAACEKVQAA